MIHMVTNNPRILVSYPKAKWVLGKPIDVLSECRRKVHEGYPLLAHPIMGDIHLLANPFRTVILGDRKKEVDLLSLQWIEESIEKIRSVALKPEAEENLGDYQIIDFELVRAVMKSDGLIKPFNLQERPLIVQPFLAEKEEPPLKKIGPIRIVSGIGPMKDRSWKSDQ
jgi:hypothetical protein